MSRPCVVEWYHGQAAEARRKVKDSFCLRSVLPREVPLPVRPHGFAVFMTEALTNCERMKKIKIKKEGGNPMGELVPLSRTEMYLAVLAGEDHKTPKPFTRSEMYLAKIMEQAGDLVSATVEAKKAAEAAIAAAEAADAAHGASGAALLDITIPTEIGRAHV